MENRTVELSLIIPSYRRNRHLNNALYFINRMEVVPNEVIIVDIDNSTSLEPYERLNINRVKLQSDNKRLNIGAARNAGANAARNELLTFLDVDCIPGEDFFRRTVNLVRGTYDKKGVLMAEPRYMTKTIASKKTYSFLDRYSHFHPHRSPLKEYAVTEQDYSVMWSLNLTTFKKTFETLGGFDVGFKGYGAEDTDFAWRCREHNIPFIRYGEVVYHQQHTVFRPPLNHFESIIDNARLFNKKWGALPMLGYLRTFEEMGLVHIEDSSNQIEILRQPTWKEVVAAEAADAPYV